MLHLKMSTSSSVIKKNHHFIAGASQPWCMKNTDAEFNVGMSLGFLQSQTENTSSHTAVYIVMNGLVIPAKCANRDSTGLFVCENEKPTAKQ